MTISNRPIINQDNPEILVEAGRKRERVRAWLQQKELDGVIISRRDNFAWLTCGGDSKVLWNTDGGVGHLVITQDLHYLVAYYMDSARLVEEQAPGQGYEPVTMYWHEGDPRLRAKTLAGERVGADTSLPDVIDVSAELVDLHYPLTPLEIDRYRWLGQQANEVMVKLALEVEPGMTEQEIADRLHIEHIKRRCEVDVLIVGCDARISRYRHPLPTHNKLERYVLLHTVSRRWGLNVPVSRSVSFGEPSGEIKRAFETAALVEARVISGLKPGLKFADILTLQKATYAEAGYPDEWNYHFQGGPTGYNLVDTLCCLTEKQMQLNQPFAYFVTVTGAKTEEISLLTQNGPEIISAGPGWPMCELPVAGAVFAVPDMMIR